MTQSFRGIVRGRGVVPASVQAPGLGRRVSVQRLPGIPRVSDQLGLGSRHLMMVSGAGSALRDTLGLVLTRGLVLRRHPLSPDPLGLALPGQLTRQELGA